MSASLDILNCTMGTITSKADHSVAFRINTPELLPSHAGELMGWHGRACRVILFPHDEEPTEKIVVNTGNTGRSPSQRLRGAFYSLHQHQELSEPFQTWYERQMEALINGVKAQME